MLASTVPPLAERRKGVGRARAHLPRTTGFDDEQERAQSKASGPRRARERVLPRGRPPLGELHTRARSRRLVRLLQRAWPALLAPSVRDRVGGLPTLARAG